MKQDTSKSPWNTDAKKGWSKIVAAKRIPGKVSGTQARHLIRWKNGNTGCTRHKTLVVGKGRTNRTKDTKDFSPL